jgi:hypothetical protein
MIYCIYTINVVLFFAGITATGCGATWLALMSRAFRAVSIRPCFFGGRLFSSRNLLKAKKCRSSLSRGTFCVSSQLYNHGEFSSFFIFPHFTSTLPFLLPK